MSTAPQCNICSRPARWVPWRKEYTNYCGTNKCTNINRVCTACGQSFLAGKDGAGSKRCALCRAHPHSGSNKIVLCAWCGSRAAGNVRRTDTWPVICAECLRPLARVVRRLKDHHVPHERARDLARNPGCDICGRNLLEAVRDKSRGALITPLNIDHDHSCCPGRFSCGECIRGLVCFNCNVAVGMLGDNLEGARALVSYLEKWQTATR